MHEKLNLPWIFEIDTIFHHFLHGFWKFFRGVFRCVFRPCVFEKVPLLQSATCQDTMVFTMESNDFHVSRFSGQGKKNRDSGQNFDAKNVANSGQNFLENPMPKIMEFHQKSMEIHLRAGFSGRFVASGHFLLPRSALQRPDATWQRPRSGPWHVASGPWHVASGPWPVARGTSRPVTPSPPVAERSGYSGRYIYIYIHILYTCITTRRRRPTFL